MEKVSINLDEKAIENEIVERLFDKISRTVEDKVNNAISVAIKASITNAVDTFIKEEVPKLLDKEFVVTNTWGEKKETSTVRDAILKAVKDQCEYKKQSYPSDENAMTKAIREAVDKAIKPFNEEIYKKVNGRFTEEIILIAEKTISTRLRLK